MTLFRRHLLFGAYCLLVTAAHQEALRALIDYSRQDSTASHLILIPFVSAALVYRSRLTIFSSVRWSVAPAAGLGAIGAGLWLWAALAQASHAENRLSLAVAALVVMLVAGFLLCYGHRASRAALFPLLFLGFTIPIPPILLNSAIAVLKSGSTEVVAGLFALTGTPFHRDGFIFSLPGVVIEVADACSGIRSSIALLLTSLLAGHMFLEKPWAKFVLAAAILPVTVFKNGIRIVSLTLLAVHVDPGFLTGQLHHEGGFLFFLLALAVLVPVFLILNRFEGSRNFRLRSNPISARHPAGSFPRSGV